MRPEGGGDKHSQREGEALRQELSEPAASGQRDRGERAGTVL